MVYVNKIKVEARRKKISLKKVAEYIGMSEAGMHRAFFFNLALSSPGVPSDQAATTITALFKLIDVLAGVLQNLQAVSARLNLHLQNKNYRAVGLRLEALREFLQTY